MENTLHKLQVLSADSQYDLACACGTGKDDRRTRGIDGKWLYPVPLTQGGVGIMLKTLLSNCCSNDCKYCPLRSGTNVQRCSLTPDETARVFMEYLRHKHLIGLFLSSGVINNPDFTMDRLNATAAILRKKYQYRGYIHLKIIPGASDAAIAKAVSLASAVSLNIETPGEKHFNKLSLSKNYTSDIIRPVKLMSQLTSKGSKFSKVKCTTQFIVGASDEKDHEILSYMDAIYNRLKFERIYFSAYQPGLGASDIPGENEFCLKPEDHFMREHRLYQSDFLIRQYGFALDDFIYQNNGNLNLSKDPKQVWADAHPEYFPVNVNWAEQKSLLRVPGLGPGTVKKILKYRKIHKLQPQHLPALNLKGKRLSATLNYIIFD